MGRRRNRTENVEDKTHIPGGTHTESPTAPKARLRGPTGADRLPHHTRRPLEPWPQVDPGIVRGARAAAGLWAASSGVARGVRAL